MYQICLTHSQPAITVECVERDRGRLVEFYVEDDISEYTVSVNVNLGDYIVAGSVLADPDGHTLRMTISENMTVKAGTFVAELQFTNSAKVSEELQAFKNEIYAGATPIVVSGTGSAVSPVTGQEQSTTSDQTFSSFPFYLKVHSCVGKNGSPFEREVAAVMSEYDKKVAEFTATAESLFATFQQQAQAKLDSVQAVLDTKVTAVNGMGLSQENFTTALKDKLVALGGEQEMNLINTRLDDLEGWQEDVQSGSTRVVITEGSGS